MNGGIARAREKTIMCERSWIMDQAKNKTMHAEKMVIGEALFPAIYSFSLLSSESSGGQQCTRVGEVGDERVK